jgi:DNA-binding NarL/FixJ family response regulator
VGPERDRPRQGRLKVFIVEDYSPVRERLGDSLEQVGFEVVGRCPTADATAQGIDRARADVCVLGLGLSGRRAIRVCQEMRAQASAVPCVVLALRYRAVEAVSAFGAGTDSYVLAGLPPRGLVVALTEGAGGRRGGN